MDFVKNNNTAANSKVFLYAFAAVYAAAILYLCSALNVWIDEVYTLDTSSSKYSLRQVIHQSYFFESQPPLYFILMWLWRKISSTIFWARMFSVLSIAAAAWYFFKLCIQVVTTATARWLLVLFLINPFTVFAILEIRLYAFIMLLAVAAVYYCLQYLNGAGKKNLYLFLAVCLLGLYTQYFFAFLMAAFVLAAWLFYSFKQAFTLALYMLPVVLLFLPNVYFMQSQLTMVQEELNNQTTMQRLLLVLHSPQNVLLGLEALPVSQWLRRILLLAAVGTLVWLYVKARQKQFAALQQIHFFIVVIAAVTSMLALFTAVAKTDHNDRYFAIVLPLLVFLLAIVSAASSANKVIYPLFFIFFIAAFIVKYQQPVKQYDYKQLAVYVTNTAKKNEPVFFYHTTIVLPFRYYYNGANPALPIPGEVKFDNNYMQNVTDTLQVKKCIDALQPQSPSFMLITDLAEERYKNNEGRNELYQWLQQHYQLKSDTLFYGNSANRPLRVRRYLYQ